MYGTETFLLDVSAGAWKPTLPTPVEQLLMQLGQVQAGDVKVDEDTCNVNKRGDKRTGGITWVETEASECDR
jgi:hypothetical protein